MTGPTPAGLAAVDQLAAANRRAADHLLHRSRAHARQVWPDVGPIARILLDRMAVALADAHAAGQPALCDHLAAAIDLGVWLPQLPRWVCETCAKGYAQPRLACDHCAIPTRRLYLTVVGLPAWFRNDPPRIRPPLLAMLVLCADCHARNQIQIPPPPGEPS